MTRLEYIANGGLSKQAAVQNEDTLLAVFSELMEKSSGYKQVEVIRYLSED